jgi:hypothetical protein
MEARVRTSIVVSTVGKRHMPVLSVCMRWSRLSSLSMEVRRGILSRLYREIENVSEFSLKSVDGPREAGS